MGRGVNLNPKAFVDTPTCDLCFEDALEVGRKKSDALKPQDFKETSIRFCVDGLRDWYATYAEDVLSSSIRYVLRDISWQWASFCTTDPTLTKARTAFVVLRKEITENTAYTDLIDRMKQQAKIKEFGYTSRRPFNLDLPLEAMGVISRTGEALGIPFSRFFQVGLGWSLSTNRQGMYAEWTKEVFTPLQNAVMDWAKGKLDDLLEVEFLLHLRLDKKKK